MSVLDSCCSVYSWLKPHGHRNWEATGRQGPKLGLSQGESQQLKHPAGSFDSLGKWKESPDPSCGKLFSPGVLVPTVKEDVLGLWALPIPRMLTA